LKYEGANPLFYLFTRLRTTANVNYYLFMIAVGYRKIVLLQTIAVKRNS